MIEPVTRPFRETVWNRADHDAAFHEAPLKEAYDAFLSGDVETGNAILRVEVKPRER